MMNSMLKQLRQQLEYRRNLIKKIKYFSTVPEHIKESACDGIREYGLNPGMRKYMLIRRRESNDR